MVGGERENLTVCNERHLPAIASDGTILVSGLWPLSRSFHEGTMDLSRVAKIPLFISHLLENIQHSVAELV